MKQKEIVTGESYLFTGTDVEHRKNMIGTIVTVVGRKAGREKKYDIYQNGTPENPMRFKLSNGQYANAANLKPIHQ